MPRGRRVQAVRVLLAEADALIAELVRAGGSPSARLRGEAEQWRAGYEAYRRQGVPARVNRACVWCGDPMSVPEREQGGGRTKRFCSAACRQAHHRWSIDPERYPDPATWTENRNTARAKGRRL